MTQVDTGLLSDKDFHVLVKTDLPQVLMRLGYTEEYLEDKEVVLVTNTKDIFYMTIPESYEDINLSNIDAAGITPGTAACFSSLGCVFTISMSASTFSTGGSAGTAGCVITDD